MSPTLEFWLVVVTVSLGILFYIASHFQKRLWYGTAMWATISRIIIVTLVLYSAGNIITTSDSSCSTAANCFILQSVPYFLLVWSMSPMLKAIVYSWRHPNGSLRRRHRDDRTQPTPHHDRGPPP